MENKKKLFILVGCFAIALAVTLVGCFGGRRVPDCVCIEECTDDCGCSCVEAQVVFAERDNAIVAIIGTNSALANIGMDMTNAFLESQSRTPEFREIHDRDVLSGLKAGNVDVAISFLPRENHDEIMWLPLVSDENEQFYVAVRRDERELISAFQEFVNEYHQSGELERLATRHMANPQDFLEDLRPPFRFTNR